jgi:hypothetical protein
MPTAPDLLKAFAESKVLRKGSDEAAKAAALRLHPEKTIRDIARIVKRDQATVRLWVTGIAAQEETPPTVGEMWRRMMPKEERVTVGRVEKHKKKRGSMVLLNHEGGRPEFITLETMMRTMERVR